jgi:hypothetical protein
MIGGKERRRLEERKGRYSLTEVVSNGGYPVSDAML